MDADNNKLFEGVTIATILYDTGLEINRQKGNAGPNVITASSLRNLKKFICFRIVNFSSATVKNIIK